MAKRLCNKYKKALMFTGLIEELGTIKSISPLGGGIKITVQADKVMDGLKIDDSVALNGVCQTVVAISGNEFTVEAVEETMRKTTFKSFHAGRKINLERAAALGDRLGGHIVQGHVDCAGKIMTIQQEATARNVWISMPPQFSKFVVQEGSICIDGVSLTTARVEGDKFMVAIIPHTWKVTIFSEYSVGKEVNLEFDIIGKYVDKMVSPYLGQNSPEPGKSILEQYITQPKW